MKEIKAKEVSELRAITKAGLMDCKKALLEAKGDMEKAQIILRKKGLATALKKSGRSAKEGQIFVKQNSDLSKLAYLRLASETDFVSRNDVFQELGTSLVTSLYESGQEKFLEKIKDDGELRPLILKTIQVLGENIMVLECDLLDSSKAVYRYYLHTNKKLLTVLKAVIKGDNPSTDDVLKGLCMHLAANRVEGITEDMVSKDMIEAEKKVYLSQDLDKPEELREKIIAGRVEKFKKQVTMLKQPFLKDASKTVGEWLALEEKRLAVKIQITKFLKISF
ncbi:MAG: translation elongation factor Ts [SAR324 cluster bacterium]|nr:translation elongation factor Ts [SAR324 cluster bacterium]